MLTPLTIGQMVLFIRNLWKSLKRTVVVLSIPLVATHLLVLLLATLNILKFEGISPTNYSLRATAATRMFHTGIDEQDTNSTDGVQSYKESPLV